MIRGFYASVSSLITLQARQEIITSNLANATTTGYKSETLIEQSFTPMTLYNKDNYKNGVATVKELGDVSFGVKIDDTITLHSQGTLVDTDNNTDFAIVGSGFFKVTDANNKAYYTRDGSFKVDSLGYLVTSAGYNVLGVNQNGEEERIYVGNANITSDFLGNISLDDVETYQFKIVDFEDYNNIQKFGNNVYVSQTDELDANFNIRQKQLEASNIDTITQTSLLMETVNEFQANQTVIQTIDSTLSQIASEIGSIN
jgi:flagellar basal-body rod protein FlgG